MVAREARNRLGCARTRGCSAHPDFSCWTIPCAGCCRLYLARQTPAVKRARGRGSRNDAPAPPRDQSRCVKHSCWALVKTPTSSSPASLRCCTRAAPRQVGALPMLATPGRPARTCTGWPIRPTPPPNLNPARLRRDMHEPGIDSLHLSDQMIRDWKQRLTAVRNSSNRLGQHREDPHAIRSGPRPEPTHPTARRVGAKPPLGRVSNGRDRCTSWPPTLLRWRSCGLRRVEPTFSVPR